MNSTFYDTKYTLIVPEKPTIDLPKYIDVYIGSDAVCYHGIKKYEFSNDTFYRGHIIIRDISKLNDIDFEYIRSLDHISNRLYVNKVYHHFVHYKCNIDESIMFCNSFVLSFVLNNYRTLNTLYGDMISHRIEIHKLYTTKNIV